MSIGKNIKALREKQGLSQVELAKKIGVTDKAVSSWETGAKTPRMGNIQKMADVFGVEKSEIIGNKVTPMVIKLRHHSLSDEAIEEILLKTLSKYENTLSPSTEDTMITKTTDEEALLKAYRSLNRKGQKLALDYLERLTEVYKNPE